MKQGIIPQHWQAKEEGAFITAESQIVTDFPILAELLAPYQNAQKTNQSSYSCITFHQHIPLEVGQKVRKTFSVPYPSDKECHIIKSDKEQIHVYALSQAGLFYGVISIIQMMQNSFLPYGLAYDEPVCQERGLKVFLPSSKNVPFFKKLVDMLSFFKYNTIMIEVGGAMEYKKHPEINQEWVRYCADMTEYSGKTKEIQDFTYPWYKNAIHMENGDGHFLSQDEVRDLVNYCKERSFNVIPEVPSLGHCDYLLLGNSEIAEIPEDPYPDTYCPSNPASYEILFDVLEEIIQVFDPTIVNIGHDEYYSIARCQRCKGKSGAEIFADDTIKIYNFLKKRGIDCMIWGDKIIKNAVVPDSGPFGGAEIIMYTPQFHKDTGKQVGIMPATWQAIDMLPKDLEISHWLWSLGEELENEVLEKGFGIRYGNFEGYLFPNWQQHIQSGSKGAIISNWSTLNQVILQRNAIFFGLAYAYEMFWNPHYQDDHYSEIRDKTLTYLFHYNYPDLQNLVRSLENKEHPDWIEISYATDYSVDYTWFVDGVFPEEAIYRIGDILLTYSDGTVNRRAIIFGENIGNRHIDWERIKFDNPAQGEPVYKVDEQLLELSFQTLPKQSENGTFFSFPIKNPYPDKTLAKVEIIVNPEKKCQITIEEIAYYHK